MTLFSRPKELVIQPKMCHRCRERMGAVSVYTLSEVAAEEERWLCAGCAWMFRKNEPLCS